MKVVKVLVFVTLVSIHGTSVADGSTVGSDLPPKVRAMLIQEMNAVLEATDKILEALVTGQDAVVADNAQAIHDSFIMKQEMTEEDRKALVNSVPAEFIEKDKAFHELSARLAEAAREGDEPLQKQLFSDMVDACAECHSDHATNRFPGFHKPD